MGAQGLDAARKLGAEFTIDEISLSGLRGRGGGGFPTGRKWAGIRNQAGTHRYVVCNAAEGEPATFKDRAILRANPYQVVEGIAIAALTVDAREVFIGIKAKFTTEIERLTRAVEEMQAAGLAGDVAITIVEGPEEYLFGEEKAHARGDRGPPADAPASCRPTSTACSPPPPRWAGRRPRPSPAIADAHLSNPTLANNVETLANVPHILARGAEWYRTMGTADSPGHHVMTVVGDVARPGSPRSTWARPCRR